MRTAIVKTGPGRGRTEVRELPTPAPGPGEVLLELVYAGICHTDVNMIEGAYGPGSGYSPTYPVVLGHEFTARVVAPGPGVAGFAAGDRVVSGCHLTCGRCRWCRGGRSMLCSEREVIGLDTDGCWASEFVMPARNLVQVPEGVSDELAGLAEPFAVGAHAVDRAEIREGERIAIVGPGTVGLLTLGALPGYEVTMIGRRADAAQVRLALEYGAIAALVTEDAAAERGAFDVVFETAGTAEAASFAAELLGPGGRLVCVGLPTAPAAIDTAQLAWQERSVLGSRAYDISTWSTIPRRLEQAPQLESIVTHTLPLDRFEEAMRLLESREAVKVLLHP
ncbi:zinc-binding dehydrogenase [Gulosibacter sp. 10]|uniref:zinc-dependent alcohol dehydrogenase n=1 Tax=Gulosibacter sp. 10 TaxID=1255570 RepID=UPI00097EFDC8|nr:alcohol dehydrogenase catalytic domain-containing protein [Gulosibacter sp. 10]SJM63847.1 Threonine dehydrogenase and related Zn-dependent dehydrogenases [Gulosibacter sp. 10]